MRIRERDLVIPALQLARLKGGFISTAALIDELAVIFQPDGEDAVILEGRSDSKFSQKVRNLVSHRDVQTSMFKRGYAVYEEAKAGIQITPLGMAFLDQVPE